MKQVTVKAPSIAQALTDVATQALIHQDSLAPAHRDAINKGLFICQQYVRSGFNPQAMSLDIFSHGFCTLIGTVEMDFAPVSDGHFCITIVDIQLCPI
jgi:hypothetical protein